MPLVGQSRPIRRLPSRAPAGRFSPSAPPAHTDSRVPPQPDRPIRLPAARAARGCVRQISRVAPPAAPSPCSGCSGSCPVWAGRPRFPPRRPGARERSPDGHPALGVVQPLQAAEEVRQRVRRVAGEDRHEHRGALQGRLRENHRLLSVVLRVRLGGEARSAAFAEQG